MEKKMSTGPFVLNDDGSKSDREIWESEMNPEREKRFDKYMYIKAVNQAAKEELARRNARVTLESIMEDFKED